MRSVGQACRRARRSANKRALRGCRLPTRSRRSTFSQTVIRASFVGLLSSHLAPSARCGAWNPRRIICMEKLRGNRPLGVFSDIRGHFRSEYQIGSRLVWVRCHHHLDCLECVGKTDDILPDIWAAIPDAIAVAEGYSRNQIPDFWSTHDKSKREGPRLDVWGIAVTPDLGEARFDISRNYRFDYSSPTFFQGRLLERRA